MAAYTTISVDQSPLGKELLKRLPGHDQLTVDGARQMVASVAGSAITVASLVFSLTFVALTLMSQQFGPRIVLVFMNDRLTKFVIGAFAGTFLYSLIVLGAVGIGQGEQALDVQEQLSRYGLASDDLFIPRLSVYTVSILGILSFVLIIFFVHHMAMSIQADAIVARLANELDVAIESTLLTKESKRAGDQEWEENSGEDLDRLEKSNQDVLAADSGYVQLIGFSRLVELAAEHEAVIELLCRPGHFVVKGIPVARTTRSRKEQAKFAESILSTIELGERRTQAQTAEYEVNALVEVALRALSPGVNDPFTAIACIDNLTASLSLLLRRDTRPSILRDDEGVARVFRHPQAFKHFLDTAFHAIRQSAQRDIQTLITLAQSLEVLASLAETPQHRRALLIHTEALKQDCAREIENTQDRRYVLDILKSVEKRLT